MIYATLLALGTISVILGAAYGAEQSEFYNIGNSMAIEKSTLHFAISPENTLPWGYVEGHVANPTAGYPVIIQIYSEVTPVHFAQVDVSEDGTYEYKFRVRSVDGENIVNIFEGEYSVIVTKVVDLPKAI